MEVFKANITVFPVFSFLLSAVLLYFFLKVFEKSFPQLLKRKSLKSKFRRSFGFVELFVWIIYIILIIPKFYSINLEYGILISILLLVILLIIIWFAGRDIVAGFIIRSNSGFMVHAEIMTGDYDGIIADLYARNFKLINKNGDKLLIPYSQIIGKPIKYINKDKSRISKRIQLKVHTTMSFEKLKEILKFRIMTHSKVIITKVPVFNIVSYENNTFELDILIYASDSDGISDMEKYLQDFISKMN